MHKLIAVAAFLAAIALLPATQASAVDISPERRKAIEAVIENYLAANPQVIERALRTLEAISKADEAQAAEAAVRAHRKELVEGLEIPVGGNANGDVTVVEFFDYRCGVCRQVHRVVVKLMELDDQIRRVYKEWPILGPDSVYASRAALASRAQGKYLAFHDALMESRSRLNQTAVLRIAIQVGLDTARLRRDMQSTEITAIIRRNYAIAEALRFNGTPSFLIGDQLIRGGRDLATMQKLVANARAASKR